MTGPPDPVLESVAPEGVLDLTALCEQYGSAPALQWRGHTVTYREYARRAARSAAALAAAGVAPNHRVALPAELNPPTWAAALFGILATGALAVLLPARAAPRERERLLERTGAVEWRPRSASSPAATRTPLHIAVHRPATVVFTSGSSGEAKAVVHSAASHLYNAAGSAANIPLRPHDAWLVALPLSHVAGLSILFRTLSAGACALFAESGAFHDADDPGARLLPDATHVSLVETQLRRLLQIPDWHGLTRRVHAALIGGSALSGPLLRRARDGGLPVCASYGCTEMASQVATTRPGDPRETFTGAAPVLPHRDVTISDDGEILLGGRTLCLGYLEQEHVRPAAGAGGWFASGDLGRLDGGRLSVTGRRDARFISGGENIQPEEVEQALLEHPAVLQAVCVAIPDPEFGRRPAAFLALASGPLPPADLEAQLETRLARFKHPVRYFALPAPSSGAATNAIKHSRSALAVHAARAISEPG
ncbi:MAG: AMP-binding protein [Spirochaetaceae bacterium]|nr:AMP-binding protein [Spirochaetaceae bacterium]